MIGHIIVYIFDFRLSVLFVYFKYVALWY